MAGGSPGRLWRGGGVRLGLRGQMGENLRYNVLGIREVHDGKKGPKHVDKCLQSKRQLAWLGIGMALASSIDWPGRPAR